MSRDQMHFFMSGISPPQWQSGSGTFESKSVFFPCPWRTVAGEAGALSQMFGKEESTNT